VTEGVIDRLEVVDVEEQGSNGALCGLLRQRHPGGLPEAPPVGQAGERVVEGLEAELRLERASL